MSAPQRQSWTAIRDRIHGRILDSTYRPGDRLPRDADLAAAFGCARTTVHRAMRALAEAGIVERRRKGGTRVRPDPVTRATLEIPIARLEIERGGAVYGYRLIDRARAASPPPVTAAFGLARPEEMEHVRALHLADGRAYMFEDRWISRATVPEIAQVDLARESANEWLVHHRPWDSGNVQLYAAACAADDAAVMQIPAGSAALILERTTWIRGAPITHVRAVMAPGHHFTMRA